MLKHHRFGYLVQRPYLIALSITLALSLWLLSGQLTATNKQVSPKDKQSVQPITHVQVRQQQAKSITRHIVLTGRTAPSRTSVLRAEIDSQVVDTPIEPGRPVKHKTVLVRLAVDDRALRVKEAEALVKQRTLEHQAQINLVKKGYQEKLRTSESLTLLESAKLSSEQARIALANTEIRAPFNSVFVDRLVEVGDFVMMGDEIAIVSEDDPGLIVADVTELERNNLQLGDMVTVRLITGKMVTGQIRFIAVKADPSTHMFEIEVAVPNPNRNIPAGMTAELHIPMEKVLAHKVSAALLALNDAGVLGIKVVDTNNQVVFYPAQFVEATTEGLWLTGLPSPLRFITVGQGFVRAGDRVSVVEEKPLNYKK